MRASIKTIALKVVVTGVVVISILMLIDEVITADQERRAAWREECPPAYKVGDVLRSKLGLKLVVAAVSLKGRGVYSYRCLFTRQTPLGHERETFDYFRKYEIAGLWSETEAVTP